MARDQSPDILRHLCPLDCDWHYDDNATLTAAPPEALSLADALKACGLTRARRVEEALLLHATTHGPDDWLPALTAARAVPADQRTSAADWLRREAAAMDRLCELLAWPVLPDPEPRLDAATLRAVAQLLETKETE